MADRYFSTGEEARKNKPADKPGWKLAWFVVKDKVTGVVLATVYGWTGGKAVLGYQVAKAEGVLEDGYVDEGPQPIDPREVFAQASTEDKKAMFASLSPEEREALLRDFLPSASKTKPRPQVQEALGANGR